MKFFTLITLSSYLWNISILIEFWNILKEYSVIHFLIKLFSFLIWSNQNLLSSVVYNRNWRVIKDVKQNQSTTDLLGIIIFIMCSKIFPYNYQIKL